MTIGIKQIVIYVLAALVFSACSKKDKSPNVVLIVVDDLGYADMSHTGNANDVKTPHIDKLAKSGTRFTNAYATSPICSPSRIGLITSCYQQRGGTYWYGGSGLHKKEFKTIPELLKAKDYATGYIGKVHYGAYDEDTSHRSFPLNHGFDYFYGHTSARKHYMHHKNELEEQFLKSKEVNERKTSQSLRQGALWENRQQVDTIAFSTELFGKKACEYIEENKNINFFLQLSFNAVHNFTHQLPKEYLAKHNLSDYPDWDPEKETYRDWYVAGRYPNNPEGRAHYLGQLYYLDKEIGRVLQCLENNNLSENTILVFISDNGGSTPIYANNTPLKGSKYTNNEGGIRVPLFVSYPGKYKKNNVKDNLVSALDILPTICSEAGVEIPSNIDGIDLSRLLTGENESIEHEALYWYTKQEMTMRKGEWKYSHGLNDWTSETEMVKLEMGEFLYNVNLDISEANNVIGKYPEKHAELQKELEDWIESLQN